MATKAFLEQAYLAYFGRPIDPNGVAAYVNSTPAQVEATFWASPESQALYGSVFGLQQINMVYQMLFGRDAEPAGLQYWANQLVIGAITPAGAAIAILNGARNDDITAVNNKLAASAAFTAGLDTTAEILGYAGDAAAAVARNFLKTVTQTPATQAQVDAAIAASVAAGSVTGGETFTLTTNIDAIAGTTGNDHFIASPVTSTIGTQLATLNIGDVIDGGAGTDTLDIYTASTPPVFGGVGANAVQQGTVKNVEIINIHNNNSGAPFGYTVGNVDASGFVGATNINQDTQELAVINLDASQTAGFSNTPVEVLSVQPNDTSASANVSLANVAEGSDVQFLPNPAGILNSVKVSGSVKDTNNDGVIAPTQVSVTAGKGVQSVAVNTAVKTVLVVNDGSDLTKPVTAVDASASTGGVSYTIASNNVASIKGGSGDDTLNINTLTTATVNASVDTGAGKNVVNVNTSGVGTTTVTGGAGSDTVNVAGRSSGVLTLTLGDGADTFTVTAPAVINGTDVIDGGAGVDTLTIQYVGAANIGAFKNFEVFDAVGLDHGLDTQILATQNTVTEFITSGATGGPLAKLGNIDAGVNFRATGDMAGSSIILAQKTAGAFTVTLDADSTVNAEHDSFLTAEATNATALTATFSVDSKFIQTAVAKNDATINLAGDKATTLAVVSGGTNATNHLNYLEGNDGAGKGLLTGVTVTGDQNVDITGLAVAGGAATQLTSINASAFTGKLTVDLVDLKLGAGTVTLGAGADTVVATAAGSNAAIGAGGVVNAFESVASFGKASATAVSTTAPAADVAAAQAAADQVVLAGASVAANLADNGTLSVKNGVVTFSGAGPTSLTNAVILIAADTAEFGAGKAVVFNYLGDSYTFVSDGVAGANAADTLVKLVGVTGVTNFAATAVDANHFFIV